MSVPSSFAMGRSKVWSLEKEPRISYVLLQRTRWEKFRDVFTHSVVWGIEAPHNEELCPKPHHWTFCTYREQYFSEQYFLLIFTVVECKWFVDILMMKVSTFILNCGNVMPLLKVSGPYILLYMKRDDKG